MRKIWSRLFARECEHHHLLIVTSVGVRRSICEDCGNLSFTIKTPIETNPLLVEAARTDDLPHAEGF